MTSFYNLLKYAQTGIASPDMTHYDKMRASTLMGGAVQTLTGIPPLSFKANGTPLISWIMKGNGQQTAGTINVPAASAAVVSVESGTDYAMFLKTDFPGVAVGDKVNIVAGGSTHSLAVKKIDAQYVYVENKAV